MKCGILIPKIKKGHKLIFIFISINSGIKWRNFPYQKDSPALVKFSFKRLSNLPKCTIFLKLKIKIFSTYHPQPLDILRIRCTALVTGLSPAKSGPVNAHPAAKLS